MEIVFLVFLSIILLFLGILAYKSDIKNLTNRYFLLFVIITILWIVFNYFSNNISNYSIVIWLNRLIFISTTTLVWVLFEFASVYPNSEHIFNRKLIFLSKIFTLFVVILGFTKGIVSDVVIEKGFSSITFGILSPIYLIHLLAFLLGFFIVLLRKYKKYKGIQKVQLQYLIFGIVVTAIGVIFTNLILPFIFNIFYLSNYGPVFFLSFAGFTFFSMIKHRLFGIKFLIGKILFYLILSIFFLAIYFSINWVSLLSFGGIFDQNSILLAIIISPIFSWIFIKFSENVFKVIEEKYVFVDFHPVKTLSKFIRETSTELDVNRISVYVVNTVKKALDIKRVGIIIFDKENTEVLFKKLIGFNGNSTRELLQVVHYWKDIHQDPILFLDEIKNKKNRGTDPKNRIDRIIKSMSDEQISVILPLNRKVQLNGILIIGERKDSKAFSIEDIEFLEDIIANASVAIGRAILFQEVKSFSETLKIKVQEQTKDLNKKVLELNEARRKEKDMIDIMGHELRTPLTIIKNYFELLNRYIVKKGIKNDLKLNEYLQIIEESIVREVELINTLLNATKLEEGKIKLDKEPLNIIEIINNGVRGQEEEAKVKDIKLSTEIIDKDIPQILGDKVRVQEIFDNLLSNAVKYTEKGSVKVKIGKDKKYVVVDIIDTGIGISQKDLKQLGGKFFRSDQYIDRKNSLVRPGGTGLGLFVTFGLIKEHGGKILVKSIINKGSIFSVKLPISNEEKIVNPKKKPVNMFERLNLKK